MRNYLRLLSRVIGPQREGLLSVFGLFILMALLEAIGIGLVIPLFSILDLGYNNSSELDSVFGKIRALLENFGLGDPARLFVVLAIVFYAKGFMGYVTQKAIFSFGFKHQKRLIDGLVQKYQTMSIAEFTKQESSVLIQNLIGNVEVVCLGSIVASIRLLSEVTVIIFIATILFLSQPTFSILMMLLITTVILAYDRLFKKRIRCTGELAVRAREAVIRNFQAVMQGFKEIHVIGRMEYFNRLIFEGTSNVRASAVEYKALNAIPRYMMESAVITGFAAIFIIGGYLGMSQGDILTVIGIFAVAALRIIPGANQVSASITQIRNSRYALERVAEGLDVLLEDDRTLESDHTVLARTSESILELGNYAMARRIEFRDVMFRYQEGGNLVLKGINLDIAQGQIVGFKGSSGSGKSTSLDLILGFYATTAGTILVDGRPLPHSSLNWVTNFAYVPQHPFLFAGSIRENIALGVPESMHGISLSEAIRLACLEDFVAELPDGIDSDLGERAVNISGGQRQRIALARAFYLNRPFIILDEPTSALDADTARRLMDNIIDLRGGKTIILTSHDSSIIGLCDVIYEFSGGRVS